MKLILNFFNKYKSILLPAVLISIFIFSALQKGSLEQAFEYNPDEGIDLMKAKLFLNGFPLYKAIWSDQPPLFTVILSWWFKLFDSSVYQARILILISSAILLFTFYQIIKLQWGNLCASIAILFLLLSAFYFELSISVMLGIPALSLAMLSIYGVMLFKKLAFKPLLILSGIIMALSLQTKFFTAFLIPIIILEIAKPRSFPLILLWLGTILTTYFGISTIFFHSNFSMFSQQLFQPHLIRILPDSNFLVIWKIILTDYDIALMALIGIILLLKQQKWKFLFPVLWLMIASAILLMHRPIWHHYYLFVSLPICWLAAIGLSELFHGKLKQGRFALILHWISICLIILTILRLPIRYNRIRESIEDEAAVKEHEIIELMSKYKKSTHWIFTDRPIFAFYADMLVPPELAVISNKRILTGNLQPDYIINILKKYTPEIILLDRFRDYNLKIIPYIEKNYYTVPYHQEKPYFSQSYLSPSYKGKIPLMRWLRHALWRYKLRAIQAKTARLYERGKHSSEKLTLYVRKDMPKPDLFP